MPSLRALMTCVLWILPLSAWAQSDRSSLELEWQAPTECPSSASVRADVLRIVGAAAASGPRLVARGTVLQEAAQRWALTLRTVIDEVSGERVLVGQSCRAVTDAAVITLALTLNPDLTFPDPGSDSTSAPAESPKPDPSPPRPTTQPNEATVDSEPIHWILGSLAGPRWGLFQRPIEEYGLGMGVIPGHFQAWLEGAIGTGTVSSAKPGAYANFWSISLRGLSCYLLADGDLDLLPCGGLDWTRVQGKVAGFDNSGHGSMSWNSLTFGAKLQWRLHRVLRLELNGFGLLPLARPKAYVSHGGNEELLRPSSLGARATLGVQWQFR